MTDTTCPNCGAPIAPGALFCMKCGADVSGQQSGTATRVVGPRGTSPTSPTTRISQADLLARLRNATLGDYEILAELGHGGMATVYLAHDLHLDRKVAIKVLSPRVAQGEGMVERFRLEARTAASLSHPNIIPIHAVHESESLVFFVMKFVVGRPLDAIIKESGPLPVPTVRNILTKVAGALGYAHRHGVIHRDVKPANIMIDAEGMPIVTDFGIAKVADRHGLTLTGAALGTPTYMSPEQCNADTLTGASDQYSLGVVAYEMLMGHPLYEGESVMTVMFKHVHEPTPPPEAFGPNVPADLARAVIRMLQKGPGQRWPSMEALLPALRGSEAVSEDSVRTQLIELAKQGGQADLLARISTPRSPVVVRTRGPRAPATGTVVEEVQSRPRRRLIPLLAALVVLVGAGGTLAVLHPWRAGAPEPGGPGPVAATPGQTVDSNAAAAPPVSGTPAAPPEPAPATTAPATEAPPAAAAPVARTVRILDAPRSLSEGQGAALRAVVADQDGRPLSRSVQWSSSDPQIVAVRSDGQISALAPGTVTITAEADGRRGGVQITVTAVVASVRVTPATAELRPGQSFTLTGTALGRDGSPMSGQPMEWQSSDERVAVVSNTGHVTGVTPGAAVITAVAAGRTGTAQIAVTAPPAAPPPQQPPPPVVREDPEQAVRALVRAYADALQAKDLTRAKILYPRMSAAQERSAREALAGMEDLQVRLTPTQITVSGRTAEAIVTGEWVYKGGRNPINTRYQLEQQSGGWVIVHIE